MKAVDDLLVAVREAKERDRKKHGPRPWEFNASNLMNKGQRKKHRRKLNP